MRVGCFLPWCRSWSYSIKQTPIKRSRPNWWSQQSWLGKTLGVVDVFKSALMKIWPTSKLLWSIIAPPQMKKNCAPLARLIQFWQLIGLRQRFEIRWARHSTPGSVSIGRGRYKCGIDDRVLRGWSQAKGNRFTLPAYPMLFFHWRGTLHVFSVGNNDLYSGNAWAPSSIIRLANHWLKSQTTHGLMLMVPYQLPYLRKTSLRQFHSRACFEFINILHSILHVSRQECFLIVDRRL